MGDPPPGSFHAGVLRSRQAGSVPLTSTSPCPPGHPTPPFLRLTVRVLSWEDLWLSIGVGGEGALGIWPLGVAPLGIGALWVAPLGVGAGAMGVPWLTVGGGLERGLWVRGPRVGRLSIGGHGWLGPPRISRVGGRIVVPRHQKTLFMGHGLGFRGPPLEKTDKEQWNSWLDDSVGTQPCATPPASGNPGGSKGRP